ncbi:hypothetical protein RIF29_27084 [Crotalaria pallida]|uniref:Calmodulin-binding domain-containing protein n=1 Tax=Crotalaria pallida TaxID=3830 RepID=A0AAN9I581_CROPI
MATKAKENTIVGKEEKAASSNSHISSTKGTTKPSQPTTSSITNKEPSISPSNKYISPTIISSHLDYSPSKISDARLINMPNPYRSRSFDKPQSPSNLTKQNQPSTLRLHNALVSPRERKLSFRSSIVPVRNTKPSKLIPDRTYSTNLRRGKIKQVYVVKSTPSVVSSATTTKKVANDDDDNASANSKDSEKSNAGTKQVSKVVNEEVKEVTNQEAETMKVENEEIIKVEHAYEVSKHDENEHEHEQGLEKFEQQLHNQTIDEKVIYVGKEDEEEAKSEAQEKKTCDKIEVEEENTKHGDERNNKEEHFESKEEEEVVVKTEDETSENKKEELEEVVEEKEGVVGGTTEGVEKAKVVAKPPILLHGKKESHVSNDMIEETASKLRDLERKNKVLALAGAFQTVIDYQTTSK